jgi:hypothetical protein
VADEATAMLWATLANTPLSITYDIGGSVASVGATRGLHAVRGQWGQKICLGMAADISGSCYCWRPFLRCGAWNYRTLIPATGQAKETLTDFLH